MSTILDVSPSQTSRIMATVMAGLGGGVFCWPERGEKDHLCCSVGAGPFLRGASVSIAEGVL